MKQQFTKLIVLILVAATGFFAIIASGGGGGGGGESVSIDEVFWSAYRNPESFDAYLDTKTLDSRTSNCFLQHRDVALNNEQAKLRECSAILQGSPAWNDCHDEAEAFRNRAVMMNDIANTIDGSTRYDATQSYALLMITKSIFTEEDWNTFVDTLEELAPAYYCEY